MRIIKILAIIILVIVLILAAGITFLYFNGLSGIAQTSNPKPLNRPIDHRTSLEVCPSQNEGPDTLKRLLEQEKSKKKVFSSLKRLSNLKRHCSKSLHPEATFNTSRFTPPEVASCFLFAVGCWMLVVNSKQQTANSQQKTVVLHPEATILQVASP